MPKSGEGLTNAESLRDTTGKRKQSETSTGGSSQEQGWGESHVANPDADRRHPFKGKETTSESTSNGDKINLEIESKKEALAKIVKDIPTKVWLDLYYLHVRSNKHQMSGAKQRYKETNKKLYNKLDTLHTNLRNLEEYSKGKYLRSKDDADAESEIAHILVDTHHIISNVEIQISKVQEFNNAHFAPKLKELGF